MWCRLRLLGPDGSVLRRWTFDGAGDPDLDAVDTIARVRLLATRAGGTLELTDASPALVGLLEFVGLSELLGQVRGEAEGGEDSLGVEE